MDNCIHFFYRRKKARGGICQCLFCACFLLLLANSNACLAQITNSEIHLIKSQYDAINFKEAIVIGDSLLKQQEKYTPGEIAFLHQYMALSFYNLGETDSSRVHFLSMLSLRPETEVDHGEISPKIIEFFDQLKKEYSILAEKPGQPTFSKYIIEKDLRPASAWRSALVPGWGQFHKNQKAKGIILGGAFWGSLAATIAVAIQEADAKQNYVDATEPGEITAAYSTYNDKFKTRRILTIATAALWAIAVGDAALSSYPQPSLAVDRDGNFSFAIQIRI